MPTASVAVSGARRILRFAIRTLLAVVLVLLVAAIAGGFWLRHELRASLPQVDGRIAVAGIAAPVLVKRDALGVPTIEGRTRADVAWATGFVHAQDRFFQMDLSRRSAAGELAELVGRAALGADKAARVHRFRARARRVMAAASPEERALVAAYTAGVNAGISSLGTKPFEYLVLRTTPSPWLMEDSLLVVAAMFFVLQDSEGANDSREGLIADVLPRPLADFLTAPATEWETPLVGDPAPKPPVPGPDVVNLRAQRPAHRHRTPGTSDDRRATLDEPRGNIGLTGSNARDLARASGVVPGSNNWAVSGAHTASGGALVADDMHLGISVPNTWYRVSLAWNDGRHHRVTGVTLPGVPSVVVGSNGDIAWGFTNTEGDWSDLVLIEPDPADANRYLTPSGTQAYARYRERLRVKGEGDETLEVKETIWGPIVDSDYRRRPRALRWVAHDPEGLNLRWAGIETARTIEQAFEVAAVAGIPAQNVVLGERSGRIAWTVAGRLPRRIGSDGRVPRTWADGSSRWDGWLSSAEHPRIVEPPAGRIWTANQRVASGEMFALFGHGDYDQGARARQIRDTLMTIERATPRDMLKLQLDDRALFLARWRALALDTLDAAALANFPTRQEFRRLVEQRWTGRASEDSAGYRLTKAFRTRTAVLALDPLFAAVARAGRMSAAAARAGTTDGPLWTLVSEQPLHLLSADFSNWRALLLEAVDEVVVSLTEGGRTLESRTWGEVNTARIRHPLSSALPDLLARHLDMPADRLPGDNNMPRVQSPTAGASERFAVTPGREHEGYFHMPGGQSGHPLSPHYRDGHAAWVKGEPTPFLPGRTIHALEIVPKEEGRRTK